LKNARITAGQGTEFVFTKISDGLILQLCRNVELSGFSVDHDALPWTQATLVSVEEKAVRLEFDPG